MGKRISQRVLSCAYTVSNELGAGFLESVYENALAREFVDQNIDYERQKRLQVSYRGDVVGDFYADFVVERKLILELKALSRITTEHEAQLLNYLKATDIRVGLILNFGTPKLGIKRIISNYLERENI